MHRPSLSFRRLPPAFRRFVGVALAASALLSGSAAIAAPLDGKKVDVELLLAVDVSWSMDHEEQLIQRDGYAAAFRSKEVVDAIVNGGYGRIAVAYVEWAGAKNQIMVVPWTLIDSAAASESFARALTVDEPLQLRRTSISGVIDFATSTFDGNGYAGLRRVIDISGDGPNNDGRPVAAARDAAVARGITINGLPLMTNTDETSGGFSVRNLDRYYADCVIGGGQAFVIPVTSWTGFPTALRRKLVLELAGLPTPRLPVVKVQARPKIDCEVGEKLWHQRRLMWTDP